MKVSSVWILSGSMKEASDTSPSSGFGFEGSPLTRTPFQVLRSNAGIPSAERSTSRRGRSMACVRVMSARFFLSLALSFWVSFRARSAQEENMRKKQKSKISAHLGESFTKPGPQLPGSFSSSLLKSFLFLQNYVLGPTSPASV